METCSFDSETDFANREVSAVASRQESETQQNASTETAHDTALPHPYRLRLCRLKPSTASHPTPGDASSSSAADSGSSVVGYGFNVHADRYRVGHFIGSVEPDSAADKVGLQPGDRIIEVAGVNVETDSHNELAEKIKAARDRRRPEEGGGDGELLLLVVDQEADEYFKKHETLLDAHQPFVVRCGFDDGEDRQQEREQQQQQHQLQQLAENSKHSAHLMNARSTIVRHVQIYSQLDNFPMQFGRLVMEPIDYNFWLEYKKVDSFRIHVVENPYYRAYEAQAQRRSQNITHTLTETPNESKLCRKCKNVTR